MLCNAEQGIHWIIIQNIIFIFVWTLIHGIFERNVLGLQAIYPHLLILHPINAAIKHFHLSLFSEKEDSKN